MPSLILCAATLGHYVDLASAGAAQLGGVASGLYLKFTDSVGRETEILRVERGVGIGGAVDQEIVGVWPVAADAQG
jgi:hypothetical protein